MLFPISNISGECPGLCALCSVYLSTAVLHLFEEKQQQNLGTEALMWEYHTDAGAPPHTVAVYSIKFGKFQTFEVSPRAT